MRRFSLIALSGVLLGLFGCTASTAESTTTTIPADPTPMELAITLPTTQELEKSEALFGMAGDYQPVNTEKVNLSSQTLSWAGTSLGGIENLYQFNMDTSDEFGIHEVRLTLRVLLFKSPDEATVALLNHPDRLKRSQKSSWIFAGDEFARNTYQIDITKVSGELPDISGSISAKGRLIVSVILEDEHNGIDWGQTCQMILKDALKKIQKSYPMLLVE